nr:protein root hair defective 3-like [Tanacetum cinerariifolium]
IDDMPSCFRFSRGSDTGVPPPANNKGYVIKKMSKADTSTITRFGQESEESNGQTMVENRKSSQNSKLNPHETQTMACWDSANIRVRFSHDIGSHVTDVRTAILSELTTQYKLKLKEALYGPVGAFLKGDRGDVWPAIREYYNCETQKVASEVSFALSSFEMDEHDKADMISELMNYASGQVELKTKEVAREVSYIMKDRYTSIFNHDNDLRPRSWTAEDDIQAISRTAQTCSLKVLSVLAAIGLDEDTDTSIIYDTLVHTLLDEPRNTTIPNDSLASSSWEQISATKTIITPLECKSLWDQFLRETEHYITQANQIQDAIRGSTGGNIGGTSGINGINDSGIGGINDSGIGGIIGCGIGDISSIIGCGIEGTIIGCGIGGIGGIIGYRIEGIIGSVVGGSVEDGGCASLDTGHSTLLRPGFVSHIPGRQFILDFENSNVRLPPVTEGIECSLSRPDFRHNEIVMDFQNSRA